MKNIGNLLLVKREERGDLLYFLLFFMLISTGMAIGRGTADALFLKRLGVEYLPLMYMAQSVLLSIVSLMYAAFADRIPAEKFFRFLFGALLVLVTGSWYVMTVSEGNMVYPAYYMTYEVASELLLVHAALYMNQNMNNLQAKRLVPLVFAGAQAGTIIGGLTLATTAPLIGTQNLLLVWCGLLLSGAAVILVRHKKHGPSAHYRAKKKPRSLVSECKEQVSQGIQFTWRCDLLRAASFSLFFMVIAFYILCYSVNTVYTNTFETEESLARFFGILTAATSTVALLTQLFITNRAIKRFGVRTVHLLFPWTTIGSLLALSFSFTLPAAVAGSFNKDALMPAFRNPIRNMFFNILPDYMQGRARAISVAIVLPLALMTGGIILLLMQQMESPRFFLIPGIMAAASYLFFARRMNRAYVGTLIDTLKERLFLPNKHMYSDLEGCSDDVIDEITAGVNHDDPDIAVTFARVLAGSYPERAPDIILQRTKTADTQTTDKLIALLAEIDTTAVADKLGKLADSGDAHLKSTVLRIMLNQDDPSSNEQAAALINSDNPRLKATAICALIRKPEQENTTRAINAWQELLQGSNSDKLAALEIIPDLQSLPDSKKQALTSHYREAFSTLLAVESDTVRLRALTGLGKWEEHISTDTQALLQQSLNSESPEIRESTARCLHLIDSKDSDETLLQAVGDGHRKVRSTAIKTLKSLTEDYDRLALDWIINNRGNLRAQKSLLQSLLDNGMPKAVGERIVQVKSDEAHNLQKMLHVLERETSGQESTNQALLKCSLEEQLEQTLDLALLALEPLYEPGLIGTIRAGFTSGDIRHVANASEVLANLDKQAPVARLGEILNQSTSNETGHGNMGPGSLDEVIEWCHKQGDEWLQLCATQMQQTKIAGETNA